MPCKSYALRSAVVTLITDMRWRSFTALAVLVGLWTLLTAGELTSWIIGVPTVLAATWALGQHAFPETAVPKLVGLSYFVPYFLWHSVKGGIDVAWRTLGPSLKVRPGFYEYKTQLRDRRARLLFANCVSLLPGTLTADLHEDRLTVHLLDIRSDPLTALSELEKVVNRVFPTPSSTKERVTDV